MRLGYRKWALVKFAVLSGVLGTAVFLVSLSPLKGTGTGRHHFLISVLGPAGMRICLGFVGILMLMAMLRLVWLLFDERLAAEIRVEGVYVRSGLYTGLIAWPAIGGIERRVIHGHGKHPLLVIKRIDAAAFWLWLAGAGKDVAIQIKLLDADDEDVEAWIEAARAFDRARRARPVEQAAAVARSGPTPVRSFGRRQ